MDQLREAIVRPLRRRDTTVDLPLRSRYRRGSVGVALIATSFIVAVVFLIALMIFVAGVSELPVFVWFVLAFASVLIQTVLFYHLGRAREKLEH